MKLHRLHLQNFRAFQDVTLQLHPEVTLLVGLNASGKSTLLDALAVAAGAWLRGTAQVADQDPGIRPNDARLIRQEGELSTVNPSFPVVVEAEGTVSGRNLHWRRELRSLKGRTTRADARELQEQARETEAAATRDPEVDLPLLAFFGTGRRWVEKQRSTGNAPDSRMLGYSACLEMASQTRLFEDWMKRRTADRLQRLDAAMERGQGTVQSPHLDAVTTAACGMLPGVRRFFYSLNHDELRVEFADGRLLPFDRLSDGQRSLVTLASELAWRAAQLNPHHGGDAPRRVEGVVLIDEIELHLHPGWQRTVLESLRTTFPRLQFILSTHSPQVLASADADWVRVLTPDGSPLGVQHVRGKDTNQVLQEIMGVPPRPAWMEAKLGRLDALIEQEDLPGARALIEEVAQELGADDPTLLGRRWELAELEEGDADD